MYQDDTIVALSSGQLPSAIAVVRVSGSQVNVIIEKFLRNTLKPRNFTLCNIFIPGTRDVLDQGLVVYFPQDSSFTGEEMVEFHVHGSVAVVNHLVEALCSLDKVRLAGAGEFTRRAFDNGRLDLSAVEGLADLLGAETESQRQLALARYQGDLAASTGSLRKAIKRCLVAVEANLDFADSEDVDVLDLDMLATDLTDIDNQLHELLETYRHGKILREGLRVALAGYPNVGKSSIFNALVGSNEAIVTSEAGTTRDVKEIHLDWDGFLIVLLDSAGIRKAENLAEIEGVRRTRRLMDEADLVLWVSAPDVQGSWEMDVAKNSDRFLHVANKSDLGAVADADISICARSADLNDLKSLIIQTKISEPRSGGHAVLSRKRDRVAFERTRARILAALGQVRADPGSLLPELLAEELRAGLLELERLAGRVDAEDILDGVFGEFCIGK